VCFRCSGSNKFVYIYEKSNKLFEFHKQVVKYYQPNNLSEKRLKSSSCGVYYKLRKTLRVLSLGYTVHNLGFDTWVFQYERTVLSTRYDDDTGLIIGCLDALLNNSKCRAPIVWCC
jgi:hypothetical protein